MVIFYCLFVFGVTMLAVANLFMRRKSAPAIGGGAFSWPWHSRDRYSPRGYWLHLIGWLLFAGSGLWSGARLIL